MKLTISQTIQHFIEELEADMAEISYTHKNHMTDLDDSFKPENKFLVSASITLEPHEALQLRKFINLHYLGDVDANEFVDGTFKAKYPEKETPEFQNAVWKTNVGYTVNLAVEFDEKGVPTFEVVKNE
jgi:hypothetical protein